MGNDGGGKTLLLPRNRHRHDAARKSGEIFQKTLAILTRQHADHEHERARDPLLEIGERIGDGARAIRVVAAVEPKLAPRRAHAGETPNAPAPPPRAPAPPPLPHL